MKTNTTNNMKKLVLLVLLFTGLANAQIVNIPDANFKAKLLSADITNYTASTQSQNINSFCSIDTNGDNEIQLSEANEIKYLNILSSEINSLEGINSFTNLQYLNCSYNPLIILDIGNLSSLKYLDCFVNQLTSLDLNTNTNLQYLNCSSNQLISLDLSANTELISLNCESNELNSLNVNGLVSLTIFKCNNNQITNLNIVDLINLGDFHCEFNQLDSIDFSNSPNISFLYCNNNNLSSLNISTLIYIQKLNCSNNQLTNLTGFFLQTEILECQNNQLTSLNLENTTMLKGLNCSFNKITILNISSSNSLNYCYCNSNLLTNIDLGNNLELYSLNCQSNLLPSLDISNCVNLEILFCDSNQLTSLDVIANINLKFLFCSSNLLTSLDVSSNINLMWLGVNYNLLTELNLSNNPYLELLGCNNNQISDLNLDNNIKLITIDTQNNLLNSLNINSNSFLKNLYCNNNQIANLVISNNILLESLSCGNNQITTLDCSKNILLDYIVFNNNPFLNSLFIKNGKNNFNTSPPFLLSGCPNLTFICADDDETQSLLQNNPSYNGVINSYCSFNPGGNYNTISGNVKFDSNNNGCDVSDLPQPNIRVNINDGTNTGASFTSDIGNYNFFTQAGSFDITPEIENPTFFNFTPATATIPFADNNNNTVTQDFCISANGVHPDLEVVLAPIIRARPGFDATYQLVYKNKGNQTLNGVVSLNYDVFRLLFISSNTTPDFNFEGTIDWNFTNLLPFESRSISLTLNVNSPVETPPVNIGDVLNFTATINPISGDELPDDNTFTLAQTVVGSFDPNDITCLDGNSVAPSEIGEYLHYAINFENTGNYPAENVVVKTIVDPAKFDINSLQLLNTSAPVDARITGNTVEFIFKNVQLAGPGGHGHVLLKVKSKNSLVAGDSVANRADIFFDYNAPVDTGLETTIFQSLSNSVFVKDDSINVLPNPTNGNVTINSNFNIKNIEVYDVQGRILQTILNSNNLDISEKANGIYFLKITTEKGSKIEKLVKD